MTYDLGYAPGYAREGGARGTIRIGEWAVYKSISRHVHVMCMYSSPDSSIIFAYAVRLDPEAEV